MSPAASWRSKTAPRRPIARNVQRVVRPDGAIVHLPDMPEQGEEAWDDALCAEVGTDLFFPEEGESADEARAVCRRCPVQRECLDFALREDIRFGVWGGTSAYERRQLRRQTRNADRDETAA